MTRNGYQVKRGKGSFRGQPLGYRDALAVIRERLREGGPLYSIYRKGKGWGVPRNLPLTMARLMALLPTLPEDQQIKVRTGVEKDGTFKNVIAIKGTAQLPAAPPPWSSTYLTRVNDRIRRVAAVSYAYDEEVDCLGALVCKHVTGTNTWSQHAYGNAIDLAFRVSPPIGFDLPRQQRLANYLVKNAQALKIARLIHMNRIWQPSTGWTSYAGVYHTHVHVDCLPQGSGTPDCAR